MKEKGKKEIDAIGAYDIGLFKPTIIYPGNSLSFERQSHPRFLALSIFIRIILLSVDEDCSLL